VVVSRFVLRNYCIFTCGPRSFSSLNSDCLRGLSTSPQLPTTYDISTCLPCIASKTTLSDFCIYSRHVLADPASSFKIGVSHRYILTIYHNPTYSRMATLLELSHELLHCIFTEITPNDLSAVSRTCNDFHSYISGNKLLHKDIYLRRYDQPGSDTNWEDEVHDHVKLERILESSDRQVKRDVLEFAAARINRLLDTSCSDSDDSLNIKLLAKHFKDTANTRLLLRLKSYGRHRQSYTACTAYQSTRSPYAR
jgi:hypothetical protein